MGIFRDARGLLEVTLLTGRTIWATSYHASQTYGQLLEGIRCEMTNRLHLEDLPQRMQSIFGTFPVSMIEPKITLSEHRLKACPEIPIVMLPEMEFAALFISFPPMDKAMHASGLIIIWHQDEAYPVISDVSQAKIAAIDWENVAEDFEF